MSALADALVAAQRRALAAAEKRLVAGQMEPEDFRDVLVRIGLPEEVDGGYLVAALELIRDYGAAVPGEPRANGEQAKEPATDAQRARIKRDLDKLHGGDAAQSISSEPSLTKAQASTIIDTISKGTFELEKWYVPF